MLAPYGTIKFIWSVGNMDGLTSKLDEQVGRCGGDCLIVAH